jgi:hypothetical protein
VVLPHSDFRTGGRICPKRLARTLYGLTCHTSATFPDHTNAEQRRPCASITSNRFYVYIAVTLRICLETGLKRGLPEVHPIVKHIESIPRKAFNEVCSCSGAITATIEIVMVTTRRSVIENVPLPLSTTSQDADDGATIAQEMRQAARRAPMRRRGAGREAEAKLHEFSTLPEYLADNEYIQAHYRVDYSIKDGVKSLFRIHNETGNIWTHLVGEQPFLH